MSIGTEALLRKGHLKIDRAWQSTPRRGTDARLEIGVKKEGIVHNTTYTK